MSLARAKPDAPVFRETCYRCFRPAGFCYCGLIQKIETRVTFVILIHPIEVKRPIATGRMAHLCLQDSRLIPGEDFAQNEAVNGILQDPGNHCLLLYPGTDAIDISNPSRIPRAALFPENKKTVVFVVDGTWKTAKKTVARSVNLRKLPTVCFTPKSPSRFRVRKQPAPGCYSTIEAIHHVLDLLCESGERGQSPRPHDSLLAVFDRMVERQLEFNAGRGRSNPKDDI